MFVYEMVAPSGHDSERVSTAYYRFLEVRGGAPRPASMRTEVLDGQVRRTIELWSEDAVRDFKLYLTTFHVPKPAGLHSPERTKSQA